MNRITSQRLATAAGTSLVFLVCYGLCNALASVREGLPVIAADWELAIPLVPATIIPYMSIDLFFVLTPWLCRTSAELVTLAKRLTLATLIACGFFLLMPLTVGFPRELPDSVFAPLFGFLHGFDAPHNAFPSLHVALAAIIAPLWLRATHSWLRAAVAVWFGLIVVSTLTTHQHHIIDVLGGGLLGLLMLLCIRTAAASVQHRRMAQRYSAGSLVCCVGAATLTPWLLWPALALLVVACSYAFNRPQWLGKTETGRRHPLATLLLLPWLGGLELTRCWYRARLPQHTRLTDALYIGQLPRRRADLPADVEVLVDCCCEQQRPELDRNIRVITIPMPDLCPPTKDNCQEVLEELEGGGRVIFIACALGCGRSASLAASWLHQSGHCRSLEDAAALITARQPLAHTLSYARP